MKKHIESSLTEETARAIACTLVFGVQDPKHPHRNAFILSAHVRDGAIVFTGGKFGDASIWVNVSSKERVLAHWDGYVAATVNATH